MEHLRRICKEKTERYDYFLQAVEDYYIMDDEISINEEIHEDGSVEIRKIVCGVEFDKPWISIDPDGAIENAGRLKYVQVMKDHGVEIVFENTK